MSNFLRHVVLIVTALLTTPMAQAADWPNFRGPNHDGICTEKGILAEFKEPPKVVWERQIGSAFSSFAVVGGKVYTCGTEDKQQVLLCLSADKGEVLWKVPFEKEYKDSFGDGCRATPTVSNGLVYIVGAHGKVLCCNADTGSEVWSAEFDHKPQWGYSGSVLVEGDLAIFQAGKGDGALRAVNRKTGKQVWKCDSDEVGYATPMPFDFGGTRYVCSFNAHRAVIANLKTGKKAASISWETDWNVNAAAPMFHDGHLFLNSGYKTGCGLFAISAKGKILRSKEVWRSKVLLNKFQSAILTGGKLFASDEKAFKCVDFMTGKEEWKIPRISNGTLILVEGNLFLLTEKGELQVGKPRAEGWNPHSKAQILDDKCWTVPVISGGKLYARNLERVVCLDVKK